MKRLVVILVGVVLLVGVAWAEITNLPPATATTVTVCLRDSGIQEGIYRWIPCEVIKLEKQIQTLERRIYELEQKQISFGLNSTILYDGRWVYGLHYNVGR